MKRSELEKHLGKIVEVTLFDDEKITGELHKTGEEQFKDNPNLLYPHNYYFLINPQSFLFKCSHIKKIAYPVCKRDKLRYIKNIAPLL